MIFVEGSMIAVEGMGDEVIIALAGVTIVVGILLFKTLSSLTGSQEPRAPPSTVDANDPIRTSSPDCAICLSETRYAVQTNCGHIYCGDCIFEVWRRTNQLSATSCPYCRQRITLILTYFTQEERNTAEPPEIELRNAILTNVHMYNRRYSGEPRSFLEVLRDVPTLITHLFSRLFTGEDGFTVAFQLRIVVLVLFWILYLLSPLDLIPEAAFGIVGLMDDIVVFIFLSMYLTTLFRAVMSQLGGQNLPAGVNE